MLQELKQHLEKLEFELINKNQIQNDPLSRVLKFSSNLDRDVVGFIAAALAYGNVKQILNSIDQALSFLGKNPYEKLKSSNAKTWQREIPKNFKHRFNTAHDLRILYTWLGEALRQEKNLENYFINSSKNLKPSTPITDQLEDFISKITSLPCKPYKMPQTKGVLFFFSRPSLKSSCKRLFLFLRWMAGSGPAASGHWTKIDKSKLIIPVDTHVLRISQNLNLTNRKTADLKTALQITENLKKINPQDPTRYDFALCHMGISQACPSKLKIDVCTECGIKSFCKNWVNK